MDVLMRLFMKIKSEDSRYVVYFTFLGKFD